MNKEREIDVDVDKCAKRWKEAGEDGWLETRVGKIPMFDCSEDNMPRDATCCFFGKRRSGKSTTIFNLAMHVLKDIPFGLVMSNTTITGTWEAIMPKKLIVQGLRQDVLEWLTHRQERLIGQYGLDDKRSHAFIIFDDVIADQKAIRWGVDLNQFFIQGRHMGLTVFLASQNIKGIGPLVRRNSDYCFVQPIYNIGEKESVWGLEGGVLPKKEFYALLEDVAQSNKLPGSTARDPKKEVRILVCAGFEDTPELEERFQWWKPVFVGDLPPFKLCHAAYWKEKQAIDVDEIEQNEPAQRSMMMDIYDNCSKANNLLGGNF
jgi:hypothetical protein